MKILLAVDDSPCSDAAVDAVARQFAPAQVEIRLLHVDEWPKGLPPYLAFVEGPVGVTNILADGAERQRQGEAVLSRAADRLAAARFRTATELRHGDAGHEILECAAAWHPDLIVLGSHGLHGIDRFVLGSVSEGVLRRASCSVEVVK